MSSIHDAFPLEKFHFGLGRVANYKKALELLDAGADPNEVNEDGLNLLHLIAECWRGRGAEQLVDFMEYMPQVLEKALPLMKDKGVNQQLKSSEEYKNSECTLLRNNSDLLAKCTPLHLAVSGPESKAYAHYKTARDMPHHQIPSMTHGEIDKKCKAYYEMFIIKLLDWGADRNIKNGFGEDALAYIGSNRSKISEQNKVKKLLDKYSRI